jgi:hypothetical protein
VGLGPDPGLLSGQRWWNNLPLEYETIRAFLLPLHLFKRLRNKLVPCLRSAQIFLAQCLHSTVVTIPSTLIGLYSFHTFDRNFLPGSEKKSLMPTDSAVVSIPST